MKKHISLILMIVTCPGAISQAGVYGGGSGTEADPYLISDPNHMQEIGV